MMNYTAEYHRFIFEKKKTVQVNLQCDRCCAPARLRGGFEEMNEWRKGMEILKRDMKDRKSSILEKKLPIISENDTVEPKLTRSRLPKEFVSEEPLHYKYVFNLEIKSIYPSVNATSGEKFGETMIHVSHTPEHVFAAQTECSLY